MAYNVDKSQEEKVAEIMSRVEAARNNETPTEAKTSEHLPRKKNLTEQELVAEILNKKNKGFDPIKARENIALQTRCISCGRTLSSLERITFENKCYACMKEENVATRDRFVKKYILIAFAFIVAIVLGGYCANAGSLAWRIVGVVFSALVTGVSLCYVFYTNMDKIFPKLGTKAQIRVVFTLALSIAALIAFVTYLSSSWILYVVLMIGVGAYLFYLAYGELQTIKERDNRLQVYERKSRNKEYVESITEDIEKRSLADENASVNAISIENTDYKLKNQDSDAIEKIDEKDNVILPPEVDEITIDDIVVDDEVIKKEEEVEPILEAAEEPDDSGDFSI